MNGPRLSQDAEWALRYRARHTRPVQKKATSWLLLWIVAALLLALAIMLIASSCTKAVSPNLTGSVWQCISEPHISIAFDSYDSQGYAYCRVFVRGEITEGKVIAKELAAMFKDGHWEQTEPGDPLLLPPPPNWGEQPQKKGMNIRINGSIAIRMATLTPLPDDDVITIMGKEESK